MAGRVEGKVAFITGAARGQGRSHALRLAEEGADIIAVDLCGDIESNPYPLGTAEELAETERSVKALGRRVVTARADVRERHQLREVLEDGVAEMGSLDIVVANAGILPMAMGDPDPADFQDAVDVDLLGVINTVAASLRHLSDGASVIITGSVAALLDTAYGHPVLGPGGTGYSWSKKTLMSYAERMALFLGPRFIRVNCVHPTNVNTGLLHNDGIYRTFRPDLESPTRADAELAFPVMHAMPIPYVEAVDISQVVLFLASDESRYVTGQQIKVDAGAVAKRPDLSA